MSSDNAAYSPGLDSVRGAAVACVVLHHALVPGFGGGGLVGVTLFFVLSAFPITGGLLSRFGHPERQPAVLAGFYLQRLRRLYPAMLVLLVALVAYGLLERRADAYLDRGWKALSGGLNWFVHPGYSLLQLGHLWTIALELQFYAAWGLVVWVVGARRRRALLSVALLAAFVSVVLRLAWWGDGSHWQRLYLGTDTRADAFAIGAALALVARPSMTTVGRAAGLLTGAVPLVWLSISGSQVERLSITWGLTVAAVGGAAIVAVMSRCGLPSALAPLAMLGRISYGVYLWHYPIIRTLIDEPVPVPQPLWVAGLIAASLLAGWLSYRLIETRFWHSDRLGRGTLVPV